MSKRIWRQLLAQPGLIRTCAAVGLMVFVTACCLGSLQVLFRPAMYVSTAVVQFNPILNENGGPSEAGIHDVLCGHFIKTECEVAKSDPVLEGVAEGLTVGVSQRKKMDLPDKLAELKSRLTVRPGQHTNTIEIRATGDDAREAFSIANDVAESYVLHQFKSKEPDLGTISGVHIKRHPAVPPQRPEPQRMVYQFGRIGLGAAFLSLAAAAAVGWLLGCRKGLQLEVFVLLFVLVFCSVTGFAALRLSTNIWVGVTIGLWLAFVAAAVGHWALFLHARLPILSKAIPAVIVALFVLFPFLGIFSVGLGPGFYRSEVAVRLDPYAGDAVHPTVWPHAGVTCDRRFIETESALIWAAQHFEDSIKTFRTKWQREGELSSADMLRRLRAYVDVTPVPGTRLVRIAGMSTEPKEASTLACEIALAYRQHRNGCGGPDQVRVSLIHLANEPTLMPKGRRLIATTVPGAFFASFAAGGVLVGVWLVEPASKRFRVLLPALFSLILLVLILSGMTRVLAPATFESTCRLRLVVPARLEPWAARAATVLYDRGSLYEACQRLTSEEVLNSISEKRAAFEFRAKPVPGTSLIDLTVSGPSGSEAAQFANDAAKAFLHLSTKNTDDYRIEVLDPALPGNAIFTPGPLRSAFGGIAPYFWLFIVSAAVAWIAAAIRRSKMRSKAP